MKGLVIPIIVSVIFAGATGKTCDLMKAHDVCLHNLFLNLGTHGVSYLCTGNGLLTASSCIFGYDQSCAGVYPAKFLGEFHSKARSKRLITEACKKNNVLMKEARCIRTTYPAVSTCLDRPSQQLSNAVQHLGPKDSDQILSAVCTYFSGASTCIEKFGSCGPSVSDVAVNMFKALSPTTCTGAGVVHSISLLCLLVSVFFNKIIS